MRVDKIILRAALSTVAAIAALFVFMILVLCLVYPSTMMTITYDLGMDSLAVANAKEAYKRTDNVYYIAFATEVAIGADDYEKIEECGERFIVNQAFHAYCAERTAAFGENVNGTYEQYVYGQVCVAKYRQGERQDAVEKAFAWKGESFAQNNAVVALLLTALTEGDTQTVVLVERKMNDVQESVSLEDRTYFEKMLYLAQQGING